MEKEHGIAGAVYSNGPLGFQCLLECLCGYCAIEDSWEEAGSNLDDHLADPHAPCAEEADDAQG